MEQSEENARRHDIPVNEDNRVNIFYTNYKGETRLRYIRPISLYWGWTEYHPEWQWLLDAYDYEKNDFRQFAMKDIKEWGIPFPSSSLSNPHEHPSQ